MRVDIEVNLTEDHPKVYKYIKLIYTFKGNNLKLSNIEKALSLSYNKYCGVAAMLEKAAQYYLDSARVMMNGGRYMYVAFMSQQAIEKLSIR